MAFKLSKADLKRKAELVAQLTTQETVIDAMVNELQEIVERYRKSINDEINKYNNMLHDNLERFRADLVSAWDDAISDKSDAWQESERGEAANALKEAWDEADFDEIEPFEVVKPEWDTIDEPKSQVLDQLPDEAEL